MKLILIVLFMVLSSAVSANKVVEPHPAAKMVADVLDQGLKIAALKSRSQKESQLCQLVKGYADTQYVGKQLLGEYARLQRDADGVKRFLALVPSVIVTRIFDGISEAEGGQVYVEPEVKANGKMVEVFTHMYDANKREYKVSVIVKMPGGMAIVDGKYLGFSAVEYLAAEYQRILDKAYNADPKNSLPVSYLADQTEIENGFIRCL